MWILINDYIDRSERINICAEEFQIPLVDTLPSRKWSITIPSLNVGCPQ